MKKLYNISSLWLQINFMHLVAWFKRDKKRSNEFGKGTVTRVPSFAPAASGEWIDR
jgi:hypothetical protein